MKFVIGYIVVLQMIPSLTLEFSIHKLMIQLGGDYFVQQTKARKQQQQKTNKKTFVKM